MPLTERIATFDNDGTLWAEQPVYFHLAFALDQIKAMARNIRSGRRPPPCDVIGIAAFRSQATQPEISAQSGDGVAHGGLECTRMVGRVLREFGFEKVGIRCAESSERCRLVLFPVDNENWDPSRSPFWTRSCASCSGTLPLVYGKLCNDRFSKSLADLTARANGLLNRYRTKEATYISVD